MPEEFEIDPGGLVDVSCDLCGGRDAALELEAVDTRYDLPGTFRVVRCRNCGLVYTNPRPADELLGRYYPMEYLPHQAKRHQHTSRVGLMLRRMAFSGKTNIFSRMMGRAYNTLAFRAFMEGSGDDASMLDVGCGLGDYSLQWEKLGWKVQGLEADQQAAGLAAERIGMKVFSGYLDDVTLPEHAYDLITMSHVLEHTTSPRRALRKLRDALKPGGRLLLMVPNYASWDRKVFGGKWQGLEVPRHLFHFEPSTLRRVLAVEGFHVEKLGSSAFPSVLVRTVRDLLGMNKSFVEPRAFEKLAGTAVQLLPSLILKSTSLWGIARR